MECAPRRGRGPAHQHRSRRCSDRLRSRASRGRRRTPLRCRGRLGVRGRQHTSARCWPTRRRCRIARGYPPRRRHHRARGEGRDARGKASGARGMSIRRPDSTRPPATGLTLDERVAPAAELARITGMVALRHYRTNLTVETKADGSPVTIADRAAESAARAWVQSRFRRMACWVRSSARSVPGRRGAGSSTRSMDEVVRTWRAIVGLSGRPVRGRPRRRRGLLPRGGRVGGRGAWRGLLAEQPLSRVVGQHVDRGATVLTTDERFPDRPERAGGWRAPHARRP